MKKCLRFRNKEIVWNIYFNETKEKIKKFWSTFGNIYLFKIKEQEQKNIDKLYKIDPVYSYSIEKFKTVYTSHENLLLDEELKFKMYNIEYLYVYYLRVKLIYIYNIEIYCKQGKKLQDIGTIFIWIIIIIVWILNSCYI